MMHSGVAELAMRIIASVHGEPWVCTEGTEGNVPRCVLWDKCVDIRVIRYTGYVAEQP